MKIDITKYRRDEVGGMIGLLSRQLKEIEKTYDDLISAYYADDAVFSDITNKQIFTSDNNQKGE